jgi:hypothetical protein
MGCATGNRDEDVIPGADRFIIDRPRCMGNRAAELQLKVLWEEILKRFDRIEVVGEAERNPSNFILGYGYPHSPELQNAREYGTGAPYPQLPGHWRKRAAPAPPPHKSHSGSKPVGPGCSRA